jgi:hypothetical protein
MVKGWPERRKWGKKVDKRKEWAEEQEYLQGDWGAKIINRFKGGESI